MEEVKPLIHFAIAGFNVNITMAVVAQWIVMGFTMVMVLVFVKRLKFETVPRGAQVWVETVVGTINGMVNDIMGKEFANFNSYIGSMLIFLLLMNLFGLTGIKPPTADYSVTLALGITSFLAIQGTAIKRNGLMGYTKGLVGPMPIMAIIMMPLNIIERFTLPLSLSLRLFGNMFAGAIIMELLYKGLFYISSILPMKIPLFAMILPIPLHAYFDLFEGAIQMIVFIMLTMVNIKIIAEE